MTLHHICTCKCMHRNIIWNYERNSYWKDIHRFHPSTITLAFRIATSSYWCFAKHQFIHDVMMLIGSVCHRKKLLTVTSEKKIINIPYTCSCCSDLHWHLADLCWFHIPYLTHSRTHESKLPNQHYITIFKHVIKNLTYSHVRHESSKRNKTLNLNIIYTSSNSTSTVFFQQHLCSCLEWVDVVPNQHVLDVSRAMSARHPDAARMVIDRLIATAGVCCVPTSLRETHWFPDPFVHPIWNVLVQHWSQWLIVGANDGIQWYPVI